MATCRPCVGVYGLDGKREGSLLLPSVFQAPLRPDLVRFVITNLAKNSRQAYGVSPQAGYQSSAESWGTGRAVSRIPRVPGGGTHRSGQAAFGNQCRGGGMFAPNKTWRRWHRKVNCCLRRHAVAAAVAATGLPALVTARGHRVEAVPELPLVVSDAAEGLQKTRDALKALLQLGLGEELAAVRASKRLRAGKGKSRNRRYTLKRGPLVVYHADSGGVTRAFRNLPGVELCSVDRLNVLKLAPGGTLGRLCLWTAAAFARLQQLYGRSDGVGEAPLKAGYHLPRPLLQNADVARLINSDEIQSVARPARRGLPKRRQHKNLLTNKSVRIRVNPAAKTTAQNARLAEMPGTRPHAIIAKKKEAVRRQRRLHRRGAKAFMKGIRRALADTAARNMAPQQQESEE